MQKNLWKGLFRPENKKLRSNIFLALLAGVLLLAMGKGFFGGEKEAPAQAETQTASMWRKGRQKRAWRKFFPRCGGQVRWMSC